MKLTLIFITLLSLGLSGCEYTHELPTPSSPDAATIKLAEAAQSVSQSLYKLEEMETATRPDTLDKPLVAANTYGLQAQASVDWSGPIEPIVQAMAKASHSKYLRLGVPPAIPVLVTINVQNESLASILRNIDFQGGHQAHIVVHPDQHGTNIIELRYGKA